MREIKNFCELFTIESLLESIKSSYESLISPKDTE